VRRTQRTGVVKPAKTEEEIETEQQEKEDGGKGNDAIVHNKLL